MSPTQDVLAEPAIKAAAEDLKLLFTVAFLTRRKPDELLSDISWNLGQRVDFTQFQRGRALPHQARAILLDLLDERLRVEREILEKCRQASSRIAQICMLFIAISVAMGVVLL